MVARSSAANTQSLPRISDQTRYTVTSHRLSKNPLVLIRLFVPKSQQETIEICLEISSQLNVLENILK